MSPDSSCPSKGGNLEWLMGSRPWQSSKDLCEESKISGVQSWRIVIIRVPGAQMARRNLCSQGTRPNGPGGMVVQRHPYSIIIWTIWSVGGNQWHLCLNVNRIVCAKPLETAINWIDLNWSIYIFVHHLRRILSILSTIISFMYIVTIISIVLPDNYAPKANPKINIPVKMWSADKADSETVVSWWAGSEV